jgi:hypothetical protein
MAQSGRARRGSWASGERDGGAGEASCRDARRAVPTAALNRGVGAWRPRGNGARRLTGGARSSVISELKITLMENSSKQIARDWENTEKIHGGKKLNLEHFS